MKKIYFLLTACILPFTLYSQSDFCTDAVEIFATTVPPYVEITGTFNGSTISTPPPSCAPDTSQDVWYKFTATEIMHTITLSGVTGIKTGLEVYDTDCTGTPVFCKFSNTIYGEYSSRNDYIIGHTYYLRIFNATAVNSNGNFTLRLEKYASPINDICTNAITIVPILSESGVCNPYIQADFGGSTINSPVSCMSVASQDIWYKFVALDKMMRISIGGSNVIDPGCELYDGSCSGDLLMCRNYYGLGAHDYMNYNNFVIGNTYYLRMVNSYPIPAPSFITFCILRFPAPANDDCANATELIPNSLCSYTPGTFSGASLDGVESTSCSQTSSQDVWYKFTATNTNSTVTLSAMGDVSDAFEIYDGSCAGPMILCRNNGGAGAGEIANYTNYIVGHQYYIRVENATGKPLSVSNFTICVQVPTLGLDENNIKNIEVYPNPANDYIEVSNVDKTVNYELYNNLGQIIRKDKFSTNLINIQPLQAGIYHLKIFDESNYVIKKIIKK